MFVRSHFHKIMWTDCYEFCTQTQRRKRHLTTKCERDRSMAKVMTFCEVCNHHIRKLHVFRKDTCTKILWFEIRNLLFELRQKVRWYSHKSDFCRAMLCISAAYAVMRCLSVCQSVTFVSCVKTNKHIIKSFSLSGSHAILVLPCQTA